MTQCPHCSTALTGDEIQAIVKATKKPQGRPREPERCPCGKNALTRAKKHYFKCCRDAGVIRLPDE